MKKNIHPKYNRIVVRCTTCGSEFETGSIKDKITIDSCSNCHPFFTGKQRFTQAAGAIEKFKKKYGLK